MKCPKCGNRWQATETRTKKDGTIKRRRLCVNLACRYRGTTSETQITPTDTGGRPKIVTPAQQIARERLSSFLAKLK